VNFRGEGFGRRTAAQFGDLPGERQCLFDQQTTEATQQFRALGERRLRPGGLRGAR